MLKQIIIFLFVDFLRPQFLVSTIFTWIYTFSISFIIDRIKMVAKVVTTYFFFFSIKSRDILQVRFIYGYGDNRNTLYIIAGEMVFVLGDITFVRFFSSLVEMRAREGVKMWLRLYINHLTNNIFFFWVHFLVVVGIGKWSFLKLFTN